MALLDLKKIREELDKAEWEPMEDDGCSRRIFLGTRMALTPSGKYYTSWANSNVTDKEAEEDEAWFEEVGVELATINATLESGEGDPYDLFVVEYDT
jgi:hypothetical protein